MATRTAQTPRTAFTDYAKLATEFHDAIARLPIAKKAAARAYASALNERVADLGKQIDELADRVIVLTDRRRRSNAPAIEDAADQLRNAIRHKRPERELFACVASLELAATAQRKAGKGST